MLNNHLNKNCSRTVTSKKFRDYSTTCGDIVDLLCCSVYSEGIAADDHRKVSRRLQGGYTEDIVAGQLAGHSNSTWSTTDVQRIVACTTQGRRTCSTL